MLRQSEPTATASRLHVDSEVATLRGVILHRPDLELRRLTPRNREERASTRVMPGRERTLAATPSVPGKHRIRLRRVRRPDGHDAR
jgi:hypothetical protein